MSDSDSRGFMGFTAMWICPQCGEHHEDHFQQCWKCVSDAIEQEAPLQPEPPPRPLRPLTSVLFRAAAGFAVGMLAGIAITHRDGTSLAEAATAGVCFGAACGMTIGCLFWVAFPYLPRKSTEIPDETDHDP
jgi:hypothetical protein